MADYDMQALPAPRALSAAERAAALRLARSELGRPELVEQLGTATVVSACSCGCLTVGLAVSPDAPAADYGDALEPETVSIAGTWGGSAAVTLFVQDGVVDEIEVWDSAGPPPTAIPGPAELTITADFSSATARPAG